MTERVILTKPVRLPEWRDARSMFGVHSHATEVTCLLCDWHKTCAHEVDAAASWRQHLADRHSRRAERLERYTPWKRRSTTFEPDFGGLGIDRSLICPACFHVIYTDSVRQGHLDFRMHAFDRHPRRLRRHDSNPGDPDIHAS